ncbi:MAG TPA: sulfite oxidase [Candidatus Limnocylindrales bacterium]|nr:sulfite oxidase [Candidatus Limnocylindrales bacterium]
MAVSSAVHLGGSGIGPTDGPLTVEELALAFRNREMPLEALRYDRTPTGLHYLVVHWDIPVVEPEGWTIRVGGRVGRPFELTLADLIARPAQTIAVTLECAGNGRGLLEPRPVSLPWQLGAIGTAEWTGTSVWPLLEEAAIDPAATELVFRGADHGIQGEVEQDYERSLTIEEVRRPEVILAWAMNGQPLEPQHGSPVRLIVPGWYGMTSVKWLTSIEAVDAPFAGFQQAVGYHFLEREAEPGEPVTRMRVRALMIPPGQPDFFSRQRLVEAGAIRLTGRAWSGVSAVERVEVGVDGTWAEAALDDAVGPFAWRRWSFEWQALPGDHELACRATDAAGRTQPERAPWNLQGMGNNAVQRLRVAVR